jgi:hypothetical protein
MECKITYTKGRRAGTTLAEWMIAVGVGGLLLAVIASFSAYTARFFITLSNYVDLDRQSRLAMDRMGQEIRQAEKVTAYAADKITVRVGSNQVTYAYLADAKRLTRQVGNASPQTLLTGCDSARFDIYQRQATNVDLTSGVSQILGLLPISLTPAYPAATVDNAKIVQLSWNCSRSILGRTANTESSQFARIVIRKQSK